MRLIGLAVVLGLSLNLALLAAEAQQPKTIPRIGLLGGASASANAGRIDAADSYGRHSASPGSLARRTIARSGC